MGWGVKSFYVELFISDIVFIKSFLYILDLYNVHSRIWRERYDLKEEEEGDETLEFEAEEDHNDLGLKRQEEAKSKKQITLTKAVKHSNATKVNFSLS
jgi:hypothetical protein